MLAVWMELTCRHSKWAILMDVVFECGTPNKSFQRTIKSCETRVRVHFS